MGKAERAIRARKKAEIRRWQTNSKDRYKNKLAARRINDNSIAEVERLAIHAAAVLRRAEWPNATMLKRQDAFAFGREMAAWPVAWGSWQNNREETSGTMAVLYLLADGRFTGNGIRKPRSFRRQVKVPHGHDDYSNVPGALRDIIVKYGGRI